jgi:N-acetyl-anhydromuramyl-L-alanine amidase AmpD
MTSRIVLVPKDSPILNDPSTQKLHVYATGSVLVRTNAAVGETGEVTETPVHQGVQLAGVSDTQLQQARARLQPSPVPMLAVDAAGTEAERGPGEPITPFPAPEAGVALAVPATQPPGEPILAYVEFIGPVDSAWLAALKGLQVTPLRYHPENSYLCQATLQAFRQAAQQDFVLHVTPLDPAMKPRLERLSEDGVEVTIVVLGARADVAHVMEELGAVPGMELHHDIPVEQIDFYLRIRAKIHPESQDALLKLGRVVAVEPFEEPHPEDEVAGLILSGQYDLHGTPSGSYLRWLDDNGLSGDGVTIGIVDQGVDVTHPAFVGRIKDLASGRKSWHATMVAGHAAGAYLAEKDAHQYIYGVGMAPAANLLVQDSSLAATALCKQTVNETGPSHVPGSVQNNSWGKGLKDPMDYGSDEATYDRLVRNADPDGPKPKPLTICFSSGNSGRAGLTRPKAAKNLIITGNSENYRPEAGGAESNDIKQVFNGAHPSSWGNCGDARIRPHVVAPGEWTTSANYDSHDGEPEYISPRICYGGGSSGASPKTAGACALLIQWWRHHNNGADPSPALLRALIVNGAEPMDAGSDSENLSIPNRVQGWGRLNLGHILSQDIRHTYVDQSILLSGLGDQKVWQIRVPDPQKPVKITLAWTDPPGPIGSGTSPQISPIVNKLALRVKANGKTYCGNQFQRSWSYAGPADHEGADNLQNVYLVPGDTAGQIEVSVVALNITTNCLTGAMDTLQQDFALVIANGILDSTSAPGDVAVIVDKQGNGNPKPDQPGNYWQDTPGNTDQQELGNSLPTPPSGSNSPPAKPGSNSNKGAPAPSPAPRPATSSEEDWWNSADVQWSKPEAERPGDQAPVTAHPDIARNTKAGLDVLIGNGRSRIVLTTGGAVAESADHARSAPLQLIEPEAERQHNQLQTVSDSVVDLSQALTALMANWEHFGAVGKGETFVRQRAAVLVVGAGTRITRTDLAAMRRLAFMGDLYLVSDHAPVLAFLAQRIHRRYGVQFRLATDPQDLAQVLRDTLAEARGARPVAVHAAPPVKADDGLHIRNGFLVVDADRHLTLRLHYPEEARPTAISLQRGGQPPALLDLTHPGTDTQIVLRPGVVQLDITAPAAGQAWAGRWLVEAIQPLANAQDMASIAQLNVWAAGSLALTLEAQGIRAASVAGSATLAVLSGGPSVRFTDSILLAPRVITSSVQAVEAGKDTLLLVQSSRLAREAADAEAGTGDDPHAEAVHEQPTSGSLSRWLQLPRTGPGATVLDVPVAVRGKDDSGNTFERVLRSTVIDLEPRSTWRNRMADQAQALFVSGQIVEVMYTGAEVSALTLSKGDHKRMVNVSSPTLRAELAHLNLDRLKGGDLRFGVNGSELVGIFLSLNGHLPQVITVKPEADHGIEGPLPEPQAPKAEADTTDYPQASRFVAAASYRKVTDTREVNRIVIHITDGGSSINGPVSWFQNPASKVSAHYIVGQDGEVVQMVRDNDIAYHANSANGDSIGIEHCARAPKAFNSGDPGLFPTAIQYAASAALVRWLCEQYGLPMERDYILGHAEADPKTTHKGCPNAVWDWDYYMEMVTSGMSIPEPQP